MFGPPDNLFNFAEIFGPSRTTISYPPVEFAFFLKYLILQLLIHIIITIAIIVIANTLHAFSLNIYYSEIGMLYMNSK